MPRKYSEVTKAKNSRRAMDWNKTHVRRVLLALNTETESAMIAFMESQPSMQGYLKELIRKDMQDKGINPAAQ